jgi:ABC-2 type transport system ATP-binding protein
MEKQAVIEVKNINKSYEVKGVLKKVLKNVSFTVEPGIHGFIGPNGAGKTTTLEIINRLVIPDSGEVWVEGKLVAKEPSFNEHLGFVSAESWATQNTVESYVLDVGELRDIPKSQVLTKLNNSPLLVHRYKKVSELSTGWKKILQLFVLSLYKPKVFIMDEPFNGLDPTFRKDLFDNLVSIKKQGGTILISTHILSDLQKLADKITMIREGEIVYSGPKTDDIEETYEEYFVKKTKNKKGIFEL